MEWGSANYTLKSHVQKATEKIGKGEFGVLTSYIFLVACSQTLYFLFKVHRASVIKYKPQGIY